MRPLLWKEMHDLRAWLLAGVALTGGLELLLLAHVFEGSFVSMWMEALMPLAAAVAAIGLAAGQVARERHTRTLDFLRVRPVSPGVIVWSKFLAGSVVLAALLTGIVALSFADPHFIKDTGLRAIREQVSFAGLLVTLLPRFWFLYALALLFSVLVDRSLKAAALAAVVVITGVSAALTFADLAPFSGFVYWLPFFDGSGGLVEAAKNSWLSGMTGAVYSGAALVAAAAAATLLKRSPERYLGNLGLTVAATAMIAAAVASANAAAHRFPELTPVGSWEFQATGEWGSSGIVAEGSLVAVSHDQSVRFLDFTHPSRPRQIAELTIPLWSSSSDWNTDRAAMQDGAVFLVGQKKQLPTDVVEIAILKPAGLQDSIALGPVRPGDYVSAPVTDGAFLYVGVTRDRVCSLLTFDVASRRQVDSVTIDRMRPATPGIEEGSPPVRMLRRGAYLYISSPSYLTTIDLANPQRPVVASQLPVRPKVSFLYGFPRPIAVQGNRLFEIRIFPESLTAYNLSDPAHPVAESEPTSRVGLVIRGAGRNLYSPWRDGLLEFHAQGNDLHALRYLRGQAAVSGLAFAGDSVYTLTAPAEHDRRWVQTYTLK